MEQTEGMEREVTTTHNENVETRLKEIDKEKRVVPSIEMTSGSHQQDEGP